MIQTNMFCKASDLNNEASVEALFVERVLKALDYPDNRVTRKGSIAQIVIGKGSRKGQRTEFSVILNAL